jgi:hypothetical protein
MTSSLFSTTNILILLITLSAEHNFSYAFFSKSSSASSSYASVDPSGATLTPYAYLIYVNLVA